MNSTGIPDDQSDLKDKSGLNIGPSGKGLLRPHLHGHSIQRPLPNCLAGGPKGVPSEQGRKGRKGKGRKSKLNPNPKPEPGHEPESKSGSKPGD